MPGKLLIQPLMTLTLSFVLGGSLLACSTINELKTSKTPELALQREGTVNVTSRATGISNNKVGKTTVFTLPVGAIKVRGDTSANIMQAVEEALQAAGYNDPQNPAYPASDAAYLKAHVEDIAIGNFIASTWATMIVHLRLETRDGDLLWKQRLRTSINALNNYERTATVAMNELVEDMAKIFTEEHFYLATQRIKRHNDFLKESVSSSSTIHESAL